MVNLTQNNDKKLTRILTAIFSILIIIIIGLVIGIVLVNQPHDDSIESDIDGPILPTDAARFIDEISYRYENDGSYLLEDTKNDFYTALDTLENDDKVRLAIKYAIFCYDDVENHTLALDILNSVKDFVTKETEIDYYFTYIDIYEDVGDSGNAAKYQNYLAEKYPEDVDPYDIAKQKELEYENE